MVTATVLTVADNGLAFTAVAERAGPFWSGRALGIQNTAQFLAASAVPPLAGLAITHLGLRRRLRAGRALPGRSRPRWCPSGPSARSPEPPGSGFGPAAPGGFSRRPHRVKEVHEHLNHHRIVVLAVLLLLVIGLVAFLMNKRKTEHNRARAELIRTQAVTHTGDLTEAQRRAQEAEAEAQIARAEAERAEERATQAKQGHLMEEAHHEDRLREADRIDPDVDHRADDYAPGTTDRGARRGDHHGHDHARRAPSRPGPRVGHRRADPRDGHRPADHRAGHRDGHPPGLTPGHYSHAGEPGPRRHACAAGAPVPGQPAGPGPARPGDAGVRPAPQHGVPPAAGRWSTRASSCTCADEHRYGLGVAAFEVGSGYSRQEPLQRIARRPLAGLVDRVHQTAHLAVLHGRDVLYVLEERAPGRPPLVTDVGVRLPAHLTASGRAILAQLPAAQVRALYPSARDFVDRHGLGPRSLSALRTVLSETRQRGYATEDGEVTPGLASVAAAVLDHNGHPVAGVAVTYATDEEDAARLVDDVRRTAAGLTRRIGGTPEAPRPAG